MKRRYTLFTVIFTTLMLTVGMQVVEVAKANPVALSWLPTTPDKNQPEIAIQSPDQNQYYSSFFSLNFTITKPESWFGNETFIGSAKPVSYYCNGRITSVEYLIDGKPISIPVNDDTVLKSYDAPLKKLLVFCENVTLPVGKHLLSVNASAVSYYMPSDNWNPASHGGVVASENSEIAFNSEGVTFYVDSQVHVWQIMAVSLTTIVVLALLVYFKKHKSKLT
jgi:hypothetical protein